MPRTYKPRKGAKTYKKYDGELLKKALQELSAQSTSKDSPSIKSVAKKYGISFSVLQRQNQKTMKSQGGQRVLSQEAEEYIIRNLNICADWGYPLEKTDLRYIVKMYLDSAKINVKRFNNNLPGPDFAESFLKRHADKISTRFCQNIKRSRAQVSPESMKDYFKELEKSLEDVPPSNIVNYDETNLTDDPGRQKVIVRRGCKYPEKVRNHSKGCTSLMIAANAEGEVLPPYVVYKSSYLYDSWTNNGPNGTRYNSSASGWFDGQIFTDWVETIAIPYFDKKEGKKILIGDNLSSHLSVDLIKICREKNIHFVFLPANSTHLTQPLDVAFFRPMKMAWRQILQKWKQNDGRTLSSVPKGCFPRLMKLLLDQLTPNAAKNIRSGFRKTGIVPLNEQEVISRLPNCTTEETDTAAIDESFITLLKEMRYGTMNIKEPKKKKKLEVVAGKSVNPKELKQTESEPVCKNNKRDTKKSEKNKGIGKKTKPKLTNKIGKFEPKTLDTQIYVDRKVTADASPEIENDMNLDIESMPVVFEEDIYFSQEEIFEEVPKTITLPNTNIVKTEVDQTHSRNEEPKKNKIEILSNQIISYSRIKKRRELLEDGDQKSKKKKAKVCDGASKPSTSRNYYDDADTILQILEE